MVAPDFNALKNRRSLSGGSTWKPKMGENPIRVLAVSDKQVDAKYGGGNEAPDRIALEFRSHFLRLGDELHVFRCRRDQDQDCPACDFYWRHRESEDAAVKKMAEGFNNSLRFLMNILDLQDIDKGVQPYECGITVRNQILDLVSGGRWGDCLDPGEDGRAFIVKLSENPKNKRNTYSTEPEPETTSILAHLPDGWLAALDDLPKYISKDRPLEEIHELVNAGKRRVGLAAGGVAEAAPASAPAPTAAEPVVSAADPPPAEEVADDPEPVAQPQEQVAEAEEEAAHVPGCLCVDCKLAQMLPGA